MTFASRLLAEMSQDRDLVREVCVLCRGTGWSPLGYADSAGEQGDRCPYCVGNGFLLVERERGEA